jgi:hypothetical protein
MCRLLLFSVFFSLSVSAQRFDPRIRHTPPAPNVKSVMIQTVKTYRVSDPKTFQYYPGKAVYQDSQVVYVDTTLRQGWNYSQNGLIESTYRKHNFPIREYYTHLNDSSWTCLKYYSARHYDSTVVIGDSAEAFQFFPYSPNARMWYAGNYCHYIRYSKKGKQLYHRESISSVKDSFWDYSSGGLFSMKEVRKSAGTDTVLYLDKKGRWMVKVINHYDSAGHSVRSEYFNRSLKEFDLVNIWANPHEGDQTLFLPKAGEQVAMIAKREYDERGLLIKISWISPASADPRLVQYYSYTFWE